MQRRKSDITWLKQLLGIPDNDPHADEQLMSVLSASGNEKMEKSEKAELWARIQSGVKEQYKPKVRRINRALAWKAAAVFVIAAGSTWWLWPSHQPDILTFAAAQTSGSEATETVLTLSGRNIIIPGKRASLTYSDSGQHTHIMAGNVVNEQVKDAATAYNTLTVPYGKRATLSLQDGTTVWLNAGSKLIYPATFEGRNREVYIDGEAYFDVAENERKPFHVFTAKLEVHVLGTAFNISAYKDETQQAVVLVSGKVAVKAGKESAQLAPGQLAAYTPGQTIETISNINTEDYTSWKQGIVIANHTPLAIILKKLSRYYNHNITVSEQDGQETFSGRLDLEKSLDEVLTTISLTTSLPFHKQADRTIFERTN
jgi:transmembrane sensor